MIILLFTKLYSWAYSIELTERIRMAFMVLSLLESLISILFYVVGHIVGLYENRETKKV